MTMPLFGIARRLAKANATRGTKRLDGIGVSSIAEEKTSWLDIPSPRPTM
jgi:hypothetical protein